MHLQSNIIDNINNGLLSSHEVRWMTILHGGYGAPIVDTARAVLGDNPTRSTPTTIGEVLHATGGKLLNTNPDNTPYPVGKKVITEYILSSTLEACKLVRRVALLQACNHPHVERFVTVTCYHRDDAPPLCKMKTVRPLRTLRHAALSDEQVESVIEQLYSAVDYLHSLNIIHNNITVDTVCYDGGCAVLAGFGKARLCLGDDAEVEKLRDRMMVGRLAHELR